jgi:hypothetical protein
MVPSLQSPNPVRWNVQRSRRALTEADAAGASNSECAASAAADELPLVAVPTQLMENDYRVLKDLSGFQAINAFLAKGLAQEPNRPSRQRLRTRRLISKT